MITDATLPLDEGPSTLPLDEGPSTLGATPGSASALDGALDILEMLSISPSGLTLSKRSEQLQLPKNSVFRITQTLLARDYLVRDPETLAECGRILEWGYAFDYAESDEGTHCVAAPIVDANETVFAALWVSGPAKRLPKCKFRELGALVSTACGRISRTRVGLG